MQHTLFIADLHLDERYARTADYFFNFINTQASHAQALYILGDFFEMWIGDDDRTDFYQKIKNSLKSLTEQKIPVYFMQGNRDFLVGKKFAKETGCKILPEFTTISLYSSNILLLHGDALCSEDYKHMKFRRLTQNRLLRTLFLLLPLNLRRKIGITLRKNSRKHHLTSVDEQIEVVVSTVLELLEQHGVNQMIHGHIHQPKVFNFLANNKPAQRIVLGSWDKQGCALKWYSNGKREMLFF